MGSTILKRVIDRSYYSTRYNRPGEGGVELKLECGHSIFRKQSQDKNRPKRIKCWQCELNKNN